MQTNKLANIAIFSVSAILFLYAGVIGIKSVFRYNLFLKEYRQRQTEQIVEKKRHNRLTKKLADIQTDAFWELEARKQLGYLKNDEKVYKFLGKWSNKT